MRSLKDICADIGDERYADLVVPDLGPYEIETPLIDGMPDWSASGVVDLRRPNPDPEHKGGQGFHVVFRGTFAECDRWIENASA